MKCSPRHKIIFGIPQLDEGQVPPKQAKYQRMRKIEKMCRLLKKQFDLLRLRQKERLEQNNELILITRTMHEKSMHKLTRQALHRIGHALQRPGSF
jgi:hypothetical protein